MLLSLNFGTREREHDSDIDRYDKNEFYNAKFHGTRWFTGEFKLNAKTSRNAKREKRIVFLNTHRRVVMRDELRTPNVFTKSRNEVNWSTLSLRAPSEMTEMS